MTVKEDEAIKINYRIRIKFFCILTIMTAIVLFFVFIPTAIKISVAANNLDNLAKEVEQIKAKNTDLEILIKRLRNDPFFIGETARKDLKMVKPGETKIKIISPENSE